MKKIFYFMIAGLALFLTACEKDNTIVENTAYEKVNGGDPKYTYLKFLNLSPGSPAVNYYLDGTKFSASLSSLGVENAGYAYNGIFPDLGYAVTSPGNHVLTAKIPASLANGGTEVLNTTISPAAGKYYTIFPNGIYDATNKKIPTAVVVEDIRPAGLDTTKVFVRMANMYAGGPALDLIEGATVADPKILTNVASGTVSNWAQVMKPGNGASVSLKFMLFNPADNTGLAYNPTFSKGRAYTIYVRGVFGNTTYPRTVTYYTTFY